MKNNKLIITKKEITAAFKTSVPIIVTFVVLGIGFGLLLQKRADPGIHPHE